MFRIWSHSLAHLGLAFLLGVTFAVSAPAATRTVINTNDSGSGSLRSEIELAESGDTIVFDPSTNGTPIILLTPISIDENLTISGNSPALTQISGGGTVQVFRIGGTVTLDAITVTNGYTDQGGGGVFNFGTLTVSNCIFSGNVAELSGFSLLGAVGGGLVNISTVTVINTTFSGNTASSGGYGGGLANYTGATATVINSTFSGNNAPDGFGGGLYNLDGTVTVINTTFSGNSVLSGGFGGGLYNFTGTVTLRNTLVANNADDNCAGSVPTDGGHNLDSGTTCGFSSINGSMSNTDPLLGPLTDNGGPTQTMALLAGSPAINAGDNGSVPIGLDWDQRGSPYSRIVGTIVDVGAYEYVPGPTSPTNVEAMAGPGQIRVTFNPSSGTGAITYTATCSSTSPGAATPRTVSGAGSPLVVTGATPGASYLCTVVATDSTGSSGAASATNGTVTPTAVPPAPSNPIPTLSEWAQIMMMLMMIATAGWYGKRMKQR